MFYVSEIHPPLMELILAALVVFKLYLMSRVGRCKSRTRMDGKVVIITGANSGESMKTLKSKICSLHYEVSFVET